MKYIFALIISAFLAAPAAAQVADSASVVSPSADVQATSSPKALSADEADKLALDGNYLDAIDAYEAIIAAGNESAGLYYNLGYSYFKSGSLGRAILNFERAKRIDPSDPDVVANLQQAYALTDKMESVDVPIVERCWLAVAGAFSSDGWAWLFVLFFFLAIAGVAAFLFLDSVSMRKTGFFSAIVFLLMAIVSLPLSLEKRSETIDCSRAIIMSQSADLSTSPDKNGVRMTVLHEGTDVTIIDSLGDWVEVRLRDGNIGWLRLADIERI